MGGGSDEVYAGAGDDIVKVQVVPVLLKKHSQSLFLVRLKVINTLSTENSRLILPSSWKRTYLTRVTARIFSSPWLVSNL